jgi:hypothetical protein
MLSKLIILRLRQAGRIIREAGLILLIALLVSAGFLFQGLEQLRELDWPYITGLGIVVAAGIHFNRKDLRFLSNIVPETREVRILILVEYFLLLSPLILLFLLAGPWKNGLALGVSPLAALVFPLQPLLVAEKKKKKTLRWIPLRLFELKFHIERNKAGYVFIYIVCLFSPLHIGFYIVGLFFLCTMIMTAFSFYEPKELLAWKASFLSKKLRQNSWFVFKILVPVLILAFLFQFGQWPLLLYVSVFPFLTTIFGLLYKYARLNPVFHRPPSANIPSLFLFLLLVPGGILIHIFYLVILFRKANKNLRYYYA